MGFNSGLKGLKDKHIKCTPFTKSIPNTINNYGRIKHWHLCLESVGTDDHTVRGIPRLSYMAENHCALCEMRSVITQWIVAISYRHFGTTYH
jgi:hypothetical protein